MLIMSLRSTYQNRISGNHIGNDAYNESEVNIPKSYFGKSEVNIPKSYIGNDANNASEVNILKSYFGKSYRKRCV